MSTGQTLRVCGAALSDHCALQLLSAGTHRLEPPSAAVEDVTATGSYAYQQGKSRPNLSECALSCRCLCQDGLSIANFAFAYAVNSGIIPEGLRPAVRSFCDQPQRRMRRRGRLPDSPPQVLGLLFLLTTRSAQSVLVCQI